MDVGREIRRLREARGWSQAKLAGDTGMGVSGISQIETGARNPSAVSLAKIAGALGVEVGDLFPKAQAPLPDLEDERREDRRAAALRDVLEDLRLTAERYERYHTAQEKLDEFRAGWEERLAEKDFDEAAIKEAGRTIAAFWPAVTALADSEMVGLMQSGYQLEEAAAQSALVPAIERFQVLCDRVNDVYREMAQTPQEATVYAFPHREAS